MFAPQFEHVRLAALESALMRWPRPQLGCAEHDVARCEDAAWYVLAGHAEQERCAVLESLVVFGLCRTSAAPSTK